MRIVATIWLLMTACSWVLADPLPGTRWTPFELVDRNSNVYRWTPGKATVVSFCAYWCDTWKDQSPRLAEAQGALDGLPVDFLSVSVDGRWAELETQEKGRTLLNDPGRVWSKKVGVDRVPTTVVLDSQGFIRWVRSGIVRSADLIRAVRESMQASPQVGRIYLTFDDFPSEQYSQELLDVLRAEGVKATLFCIGSKVEANRALLKRALLEGHLLASHSWDHNAADPQLERCRDAFRRHLGIEADLYRPPGSNQIFGLPETVKTIDPYDYLRPGNDEIVRRVLLNAKAESVVQLHAGVKDTLQALPTMIRGLRERGFELAPLNSR